MKRICIAYFGRNGAGNIFTYQMADAFLRKGIQVDLYLSSLIENKDKFDKINNKALSINYCYTYKNKKEFFLSLCKFSFFIKLAKTITKSNYEFVYIPMISLWISLLSFFVNSKKVKLITTIHDVNQHLGEENKFISSINTHLIKKSYKIITLSKRFIPLIAKKYNKKEKDIIWIKHANFNYYKPIEYVPDYSCKNRILFFGRISKYKGIDVLLDAVKELNLNVLKLKIVGSGKLEESTIQKIKELGDTVELINTWVKDENVYSYFMDVDIVVVPYIEASQSGVVMTSYTFGKPVIVTNVGGLPEQVDENTGLIVEPNDSVSLSNAIKYFYENPEQIEKKGRYCYNLAQTDYSWDKSVMDLLMFLGK